MNADNYELLRWVLWAIGGFYVVGSTLAASLLLLNRVADNWIVGVVRQVNNARALADLWFKRQIIFPTLIAYPKGAILEYARERIFDYSAIGHSPSNLLSYDSNLLPERFSKLSERFVKRSKRTKRIAIYGERGSGKTTFVREICRGFTRSVSPVADAPEQKPIPIVIGLAELTQQMEIGDIVLCSVAAHAKGWAWFPFVRRWLARRMLSEGKLLIVFDDLDRIPIPKHERIRRYTDAHPDVHFVFVVGAKTISDGALSGEKLWFADVPAVDMPEWSEREGELYLLQRFADEMKVRELLDALSARNISSQLKLPFDWKCVADSVAEQRIFKEFSLVDEDSGHALSPARFHILDSYIAILIKNYCINSDYCPTEDEAFKRLGRLALLMFKQNRNTFYGEEAAIGKESLDRLTGKLFAKIGDKYKFDHSNYAYALAGKFVGRFWSEAESDLRGDGAEALILTPVFDAASRYANAEDRQMIEQGFKAICMDDSRDKTA